MRQFILGALFSLIISCMAFGALFGLHLKQDDKKIRVDLPEEYKAITVMSDLKGYFTQDSVLHIEFRNNLRGEIEPEYILELVNQDQVLIQTEDTIYSCPFNKIQETIEKDNL